MANLKDIKKRIGSLKNTGQITKAMKMVSAAKLRRAQDAIVAARPYAEKMQEVLTRLSSGADSSASPLLEVREIKRTAIVLFTSDRGLCGGFNSNLIKKTERFLAESIPSHGRELEMNFYGRKGMEHFKRRGTSPKKTYKLEPGQDGYEVATAIVGDLVASYVAGEIDEVYLVFGRFQSAMTQVPTVERLLPISAGEGSDTGDSADFLFEPDSATILQDLLPKYIASQVYRCILETAASEHGARMSAMDSASKNAKDMMGKLKIQYNRARQAAITTELMDIINGAKAV